MAAIKFPAGSQTLSNSSIILYYVILYCVMLYYILLYYIILHYISSTINYYIETRLL